MKNGRPSTTATWVSFMRGLATLDRPSVVSDPIALALLPASYAGVLRAAERSKLAHRAVLAACDLFAGVAAAHIALRTRAIDDAIAEAVADGARQLVLVGAGLDARAWRLDALAGATVFELDHPATQAFKRARVRDLKPKAHDVRFVEIDFERESLARALLRGGHDPARPTIFVWEGVTMYLSQAAIEVTLRAIASESARGSILLVTYVERQPLTTRVRAALSAVRRTGEPILTALAPQEMGALLERFGFRVTRDESDDDLAPRYVSDRAPAEMGMRERVVCAERVAVAVSRPPGTGP